MHLGVIDLHILASLPKAFGQFWHTLKLDLEADLFAADINHNAEPDVCGRAVIADIGALGGQYANLLDH